MEYPTLAGQKFTVSDSTICTVKYFISDNGEIFYRLSDLLDKFPLDKQISVVNVEKGGLSLLKWCKRAD